MSSFIKGIALGGMVALVLAASGCGHGKESAKQPAEPNSVPAIIPTGPSTFGDAAWLARKVANAKNVSVDIGKSFAKVTYKPEVKIVDEDLVAGSLMGVSSDGHGAVFTNAPAPILALKAGDIFMVKNEFAVKVLGAQTDGDQTVIIIEQAMLVDIVQEGQIHLESPIGFHGPKTAAAQPDIAPAFSLLDLIAAPAYAQQGAGSRQDTTNYHSDPNLVPGYNTPKPGVGSNSAVDNAKSFAKSILPGSSDWSVQNWSVTPADGTAAISLKISKDVAGFEGLVTVDGTVSNFTLAGDLTFPGNGGQSVSDILKGMKGQFKFDWKVAKKTPGVWATEDKLNLPAGINIPLGPMLGGLPLTLDISVALLIHPALTGGSEFEHGAFTLGFDGNGTSEGLTVQVTDQQSVSAVAPNAMVIAFCVPRVELQASPMGMFKSDKLKTIIEKVDQIVGKVAALILSPATLARIEASPFGNFSMSNALASKADVYVQIIHSAGTTQASNITPAPCKKFQLKIDGEYGGEATLFGMTPNAKTIKNMFTKTYTRFDPASDFCKSV
jgi:hypothetical protein